MAHNITETDNLVLAHRKAWHGYGVVVDHCPSPKEALALAGLDWGVQKFPMTCQTQVDGAEVSLEIPGYQAQFRCNAAGEPVEYLGMVSQNYQTIQNYEVAEFAELLAKDSGNVKIESAGSMGGGKKVWFLCHAGEFEIGDKGDASHDYLLLSNGHDGLTPYRVTPTPIRVVCQNTYNFAIGADDSKFELGKSAVALKHTSQLKERIEEVREALRQYGKIREEGIKVCQGLAQKTATEADYQKFFAECYTRDFGEIPTDTDIRAAADTKEKRTLQRRQARSRDAYSCFKKRFDDEEHIAGGTYWNAFNAYSGLIQHDRKTRGKDEVDRFQKRHDANLFGMNIYRTNAAMVAAINA